MPYKDDLSYHALTGESNRRSSQASHNNTMSLHYWIMIVSEVKLIIWNFKFTLLSGLNSTDDVISASWFSCASPNSNVLADICFLYLFVVPQQNMNMHYWYNAAQIYVCIMAYYVIVTDWDRGIQARWTPEPVQIVRRDRVAVEVLKARARVFI